MFRNTLKYKISIFFLCLVLNLLLYGRSLAGEFVYDDSIFHQNLSLRDPSALYRVWISPTTRDAVRMSEGYRPFAQWTYSVQYLLFGESPVSFHAANILLHTLVSFLLYILCMRMFRTQHIPICAMVFFSLLPIHSEAVVVIKYREEMLGAIWVLIGWIYWDIYLARKNIQDALFPLVIFSLCYFLALSSKESMYMMPVLFFLLSWKKGKEKIFRIGMGGLFLSGLLYLALRYSIYGSYAFAPETNEVFLFNPLVREGLFVRFFTGLDILWRYVYMSMFPFSLSATYGYDHYPVVRYPFFSFGVIIGLFLVLYCLYCILQKKEKDVFFVSSAIYLSSVPFLSKVLFASADIFAERWMYFPSIAVVLLLSWMLYRIWFFSRIVSVGIFLSISFWYGAVVWARVPAWKENESVYLHMTQDAPRSVWGRYQAAQFYYRKKDISEAKKHALAGHEVYPSFYLLLTLLGEISQAEGDHERGLQYYQQAIQVSPRVDIGHILYALALAKLGRYEESKGYIATQIAVQPKNPQLQYVMAVNLYKEGKLNDVIHYLDWGKGMTYEQKMKKLEMF